MKPAGFGGVFNGGVFPGKGLGPVHGGKPDYPDNIDWRAEGVKARKQNASDAEQENEHDRILQRLDDITPQNKGGRGKR